MMRNMPWQIFIFLMACKKKVYCMMQDVVDNHPYSPLVKTALLKLGLYHYNADNVSQATANFKSSY